MVTRPNRRVLSIVKIFPGFATLPDMSRRTATLSRDTNETKIQITLSLDGGEVDSLQNDSTAAHATQASSSQTINVNTGIGFYDHMLQSDLQYPWRRLAH